MKLQVDQQHYRSGYDSKGRFCSYWTQIEYVLKLQRQPVLEIGIGNRTVTDYLRKQGLSVAALDLDPQLKPDVVGSITHLPFRAGSFGIVMACEVLEHLPFEQFVPCLQELRRVSAGGAVISLPNVGKAWRYELHLPGYGEIRKLVELSWWKRKKLPPGPREHYWELEVRGYERRRVEEVITGAGWRIVARERLWEFLTHQFYLLEKGDGR